MSVVKVSIESRKEEEEEGNDTEESGETETEKEDSAGSEEEEEDVVVEGRRKRVMRGVACGEGTRSVKDGSTRSAANSTTSGSLLCCQADECGVDLNMGKPYHKRHKVCELHAKSSLVLVNGIRQRFCQQCSRFHDISKFDGTKKSCRERLAGHNERRRKVHLDVQERTHRNHQRPE
ncbi:hypothetical protein FNV43_RR19147 [Rhamnella rubrinervis]|uniref:SBP-type domain-containing protein n=1 Tax=Rhamnella rubrinervis TaxID=2594499 RepID=A0A8K0GWN8_9ROSA|nr:hypothetical protein FNV43_RR19147 [Rhamnella rubrinervis]